VQADLTDASAASRYEYQVGDALAWVDYERGPTATVLRYAFVPTELGGRGVGSRMVRAVLDDLRARGERVVPRCSFIAAWIARHPDYQDLLAP
jgi:predicted GNAT family acetyltransferase